MLCCTVPVTAKAIATPAARPAKYFGMALLPPILCRWIPFMISLWLSRVLMVCFLMWFRRLSPEPSGMSTIVSALCPTRWSTERKMLESGLHDHLRGHEGVHRAVVGEGSGFVEVVREGVAAAEQARGEGCLIVTGDRVLNVVPVHPDHLRPDRNGQHVRGEHEALNGHLWAWGGRACSHLGCCCWCPGRA